MIRSLRLQHYRSYEDARFDFGEAVNIIVGPNASGKTNLLEAIQVISLGHSFRVKDADLLGFDTDWARLDAETETEGRVLKMQASPSGTVRKTFVLADRTYQRLSQPKMLPAVLFEPDHLRMLGGVPDLRRAFLDDLIEQLEPGYGAMRRDYRRTLSQRNALLKRGEDYARPQVFAWNLRLSELGGRLAARRLRLVERINELLPDIHRELAGHDEPVRMEYVSKCDVRQYESSLLAGLEANLSRDAMVGFTTYGPHRDDLTVSLRGHDVRGSASRGESRTLVLALKIIELRLLHEVRGQAPLFLLDDVFSELDASRRDALTRYMRDYQTFITTTDADVLGGYMADTHVTIRLG